MEPLKLSISLIQTDILWEKPAENLIYLKKKIENIRHSDLIILPEMFSTGFSMNVKKLAEDWNGDTIKWMRKMSLNSNAVMMGSIIFKENNNYFNRLIAVFPDKSVQYYDKRHLFRLGEEHNFYKQGHSNTLIQVRGWKINMLICYDLRFPVWSRNTNGYHMLVYVANWPSSRIQAWKTLLMARAIENQAFVAGINRVGKDGNSIRYSGESMVVDPLGKIMNDTVKNKESVISMDLSINGLQRLRKKFPVLLDKENFSINDVVLSEEGQ